MDPHREADDAHCAPLDPTNWMAEFCLEYGLPLDEFQPSSTSSEAPMAVMSNNVAYETVIQTCIPSAVSSIEKGFVTQDFITKFTVCSSYELSKFSSAPPDPVPSEVISFEKPCPIEEVRPVICFAALSNTMDSRLGPLPSPVSSKRRGLVRELSDSSLGDLSVASVSDMVIPLCDDLPFDDGGDASFKEEDFVDDVPIIDPSFMFANMSKPQSQLRTNNSTSSQARHEKLALAMSESPIVPMKRAPSSASLGELSQASVGDMVTPSLGALILDDGACEDHLVDEWGHPNILDSLSNALMVAQPNASLGATQQQPLLAKIEKPNTETALTGSVARKRKATELAKVEGDTCQTSMPKQPATPSDTIPDTETPRRTRLECARASVPADCNGASPVVPEAEPIVEISTLDTVRDEPRARLPRNNKEPESKKYFEVTEKDVIFGRGTGPNNHNQRFRDEVVAKYRDVYRKRTNNDIQKRAIVQEIMDQVKSEGGHFLAKDEVGWFEVTPKAASVKLQKMTNEYKTQSERARVPTKRKTKKKR